MYDKLAYALIPSGYKSGKLYSFVGGDMTFTRATTATRINKDGYVEFVPTGVPRLNYPIINGKSSNIPELLLEPAKINLQVYSEDFSNAAWTKNGVTIDTDPIIAPNGGLAYAMRETTASGAHQIYDAYFSFDGSSDYTYSVFAKAGGARILNLFSGSPSIFDINANFDLVNGVVDTVTSGTANIEKYPNGWYRCSVTGASGSAGASNVYLRHVASSTSYTGNLNEATYLWGVQLEEGYLTSYIPTFDATGSRNAELAVSGTADLNDKAGVFYVEVEGLDDLSTANRYITISDNTINNAIAIRFETDGTMDLVNFGPSATSTVYTEDINVAEKVKIAVQYGTATSDYKVFINGFEKPVSGSFSAQVMSGLDTVELAYPTNTLPYLGNVTQVLVFNDKLDTEIESLTSWRTFEEMASYFGYV